MQTVVSRTAQFCSSKHSHSSSRRSLRGAAALAPLSSRRGRSSSTLRVAAQQQQQRGGGSSSSNEPTSLVRAASTKLEVQAPFLEPFLRSFILGVGAGAMLEGGHVALLVLSGSFPGVSNFSPLLVADHVTAFASWISLYAIEAVAVMSVLKRFNYDTRAAASDLSGLHTLPKKMLPVRLRTKLFNKFFAAGTKLAPSTPAVTAAQAAAAEAPTATAATPTPAAAPTTTGPAIRRPTRLQGANSVVPAPKNVERPGPQRGNELSPGAQKRMKELRDRNGYLRNMWYAAAISDRVADKPTKVELCGKEMVLFRDEDGKVRCIENACPHRGAPLSEGWVEKREGHNCMVCPYHGWSFDGEGMLRDVPAAANKGEWPKRSLIDSYPVEERGGFVWLFYGSNSMPADARPPIPCVPELDYPNWKAVYEEMEFDASHFGVFENAIDMAHIHYLHSDSFGNQGKPEIRDMQCTTDAFGVTATFTIYNKPVNAFWALFQVPEVKVTARAFLPSTSMVTFELANGLNFTTFVNTVPISANKSVNRFALIRKLNADGWGVANSLFNAQLWDGMARDAMRKILSEDKAMVEQLKYTQLPAEYSVRADLPQVHFRKLRQQYVDMGYGIATEEERPAFAITPARDF